MTAWYNEIDPYAAAWLRNLIAAGRIAPGVVDERNIADVVPSDLAGFTQCHFFAGIGVWSYALRRAGWPDDRPVWTGSCPCQPFSAAGRGEGFADERHLWPAFHHLIGQRRPPVVFGEQVASKAVDPWIDLVQTDLEALGYAVGAVAFPSAGVGAPHIRDRTFFVADANQHAGGQRCALDGGRNPGSDADARTGLRGGRGSDVLADTEHDGQRQYGERLGGTPGASQGKASERERLRPDPANGVSAGGVAESAGKRWERREVAEDRHVHDRKAAGRTQGVGGVIGGVEAGDGSQRPGPTNGLWRDADWLFCRDGKWRPVEPGTSPLAHGASARVGRLRAYGNAINAEAAAAFIRSYLDPERFRLTSVSGLSVGEGVFG